MFGKRRKESGVENDPVKMAQETTKIVARHNREGCIIDTLVIAGFVIGAILVVVWLVNFIGT